MNPMTMEGAGETAPLRDGSRTSGYLSLGAASQTFGSRYFLLSTLFAAIIPLIKLIVGLLYRGECPIDQRIPTYMIVAGIFGLVLAALSVLTAVAFLCFIADSAALTLIASCGICLNIIGTLIISIFLFIWFILGCVWVFSVRNKVQYNDSKEMNYCHPVLYKTTFALLIIAIVWFFLQCCVSCFRTSYTKRTNQ